MPFCFQSVELPGVVLVKPRVFCDERGYFMEAYRRSEHIAEGIQEHFVQENHSCSRKGVGRGLHFQRGVAAHGKLARVIAGEIYAVVVDIDASSPTFGRWAGFLLSGENKTMSYIPPKFAHG